VGQGVSLWCHDDLRRFVVSENLCPGRVRYAMRAVPVLSVVILGVVGCDGSATDPWPEVLTVAASPAWFGEEGVWSVPFSVSNQSSRDTYYLSACGDRVTVALDRRVEGHWEEHSGGYCIAVLSMVPIALRPGETLESRVGLDESGSYRIRLGVSADRGDRERWTERSNTFVVP